MTMNIAGGSVNNITTERDPELDKALSHSNESPFNLQDVTPIVERQQVAPGLLTALLGGTTNSVFLETN